MIQDEIGVEASTSMHAGRMVKVLSVHRAGPIILHFHNCVVRIARDVQLGGVPELTWKTIATQHTHTQNSFRCTVAA